MQPEFILVTGANGTGKTTLIENNRSTLEAAGFQIIIPHNILKYATSHTDAPSVIQEYIDNVLFQKSDFVLESPFNLKVSSKLLAELKKMDTACPCINCLLKTKSSPLSALKIDTMRVGHSLARMK